MLVGAVWPCSWLVELGWRIRIPAAANIRYARRLGKLVLQTFLPRQKILHNLQCFKSAVVKH
jgi:hypothetical protein